MSASAGRFSSDVLEKFFGPTTRGNLPKPIEPDLTAQMDGYKLRQTDFQDQLRVWRMDVSTGNPENKDLLTFAKANRQRNIDLIKQEILRIGSVKISFGILVRFKRERNGETQRMKHWFHEKDPHIFTKHNEQEIGEKYDKFVKNMMGKIASWDARK
jgi:hypothetical protein